MAHAHDDGPALGPARARSADEDRADGAVHADTAAAGRTLPEGLDERDVALLDFERQWWKQPGSKEQAVRERFRMSPTRYYQLVNALVEREAALRHDPMLVKRLRRARAARLRTRTARRLGLQG